MFALPCLCPFFRLWVAGKTKGPLFIYDHPFNIASVGIMTGEALPFCKRVMIRSTYFRFHEVTMTLGAHLGTN
jgi:hypothetical protein